MSDYFTRKEITHTVVDKWMLTVAYSPTSCDFCGEVIPFNCACNVYVPSDSQYINVVCRSCYRKRYKEEEGRK